MRLKRQKQCFALWLRNQKPEYIYLYVFEHFFSSHIVFLLSHKWNGIKEMQFNRMRTKNAQSLVQSVDLLVRIEREHTHTYKRTTSAPASTTSTATIITTATHNRRKRKVLLNSFRLLFKFACVTLLFRNAKHTNQLQLMRAEKRTTLTHIESDRRSRKKGKNNFFSS